MGTRTQIAARSALLATDEGSTMAERAPRSIMKELAASYTSAELATLSGQRHGITWPGAERHGGGRWLEEFL